MNLRSILEERARILKRTRAFFDQRDYLEVETPSLCRGVLVEHTIDPYKLQDLNNGENFYLHTSPEAGMKRLLVRGSGPIYQISRVFRQGEVGEVHQPEFTLLEWYRPGWGPQELMKEVSELLEDILGVQPADKISYRDLFKNQLEIDPFTASIDNLEALVKKHSVPLPPSMPTENRDAWLELLISFVLQPDLGNDRPLFLFDYPASQAAFAQIRCEGELDFGERFEVYFQGIELCNGYHELLDPNEYRLRFEQANELRLKEGREELKLDEQFLEEMEARLPACSGVALGLDRLILLALKKQSLKEVLPLTIDDV